ncbi:hypothetical protein MKK88_14260 [Methylobacterium sp. E-005]|uniref:baseplate hub protein n=1 Tax=Methylobacterium sp. E-005 TaxID=2836549 RepID=UPI001FBB2887|nr:hypothetical protein [Methylobacterium sp. E-005]MCJ2087140.1 hypothetical protein [Methylobacterium sp. E-005]
MTFAKKYIDVKIQLEKGDFPGGGNSLTLKGHRVEAAIEQNGSPDTGKATVSIYGLSLSVMNSLTVLPQNMTAIGQNTVTIMPYEEGSAPSIAYKGTIFQAFPDLRSQPTAAFRIDALTALYQAVQTAKPTTAPGSSDVATLMEQLAGMAQLTLENNDVNCKVRNVYLPSSPRQQIKQLADAAGINWVIENDTLAIWPRNGSRKGNAVKISSSTGMVGYPTYSASGIDVTTLFNSNYRYGGSVEVQSDLTPACGTWYIVNIVHEVECEKPGGKWFTTLSCSRLQI